MYDAPPLVLDELLLDLRDAQGRPDWFADNQKRVSDALQAGIRDCWPEKATELLVEVWPLIPGSADEELLYRLYQFGASLYEMSPTSLMLAKAFRLSADVLNARGLHRLARAQGIYELAIHRNRDDDPNAIASALVSLARTYRARGQMYEVLDCGEEMLETFNRHGDAIGSAHTLVQLGNFMLEIGRLQWASDYLTRAVTAHEKLEDTASIAVCRALLSWVERLSGNDADADRQLNRGLALVGGADDGLAEQVRDLAAGIRQLDPSIL